MMREGYAGHTRPGSFGMSKMLYDQTVRPLCQRPVPTAMIWFGMRAGSPVARRNALWGGFFPQGGTMGAVLEILARGESVRRRARIGRAGC